MTAEEARNNVKQYYDKLNIDEELEPVFQVIEKSSKAGDTWCTYTFKQLPTKSLLLLMINRLKKLGFRVSVLTYDYSFNISWEDINYDKK